MALDTRNKRAAATAMIAPARAYPNPDGDLSGQADRQHIAWAYPGILASAVSSLPELIVTTVTALTTARTADALTFGRTVDGLTVQTVGRP